MAKLVKTYDENMHLNGVQELEDKPKVKYYDWSELDTSEGFLTAAEGFRIAQEILDGNEIYIQNYVQDTTQFVCERVSMTYFHGDPPLEGFILFLKGYTAHAGTMTPAIFSLYEL